MREVRNISELIRRLMDDHSKIEGNIIKLIGKSMEYYKVDKEKFMRDLTRSLEGIRFFLDIHHRFEEEEIFPIIDDPIVGELTEEHKVIIGLIDEIIGGIMDISPEDAYRKISELREMIYKHFMKENTRLLGILMDMERIEGSSLG